MSNSGFLFAVKFGMSARDTSYTQGMLDDHAVAVS